MYRLALADASGPHWSFAPLSCTSMPSSPHPPLAHFLYVSRAFEPFSEADLDDLLVRARRFNDEHTVTGLLLYDHVETMGLAQFCQYVEGPPEAIKLVRDRIEGDARHHRITYLHEGRNAHRLFSGWSMGFEHVSVVPDSTGMRERITLLTANAEQVPRSASAALLRTFVALSQTADRRR